MKLLEVSLFFASVVSPAVTVIGYNAITGHNYERPIFQLKHHKDIQNMIMFERCFALRLSN